MANFEKYRKKRNTIKCNLDDDKYTDFVEFLNKNNLTQQFFIENLITNVLKNKEMVNMFNYNLDRYVESVENFIKDSAEWYELDYYKFYVSAENGEWVENSDNADGGLDVSWAFHKNPTFDEIREKFIELLKDYLDNFEENDVKNFEITLRNLD